MPPPADVLPPPEGLDLDEIASEAGLLAAIEREAAKLQDADRKGYRLSSDEIRLISFLAGEVYRRIANLSPDEKKELERIRETADVRQIERNVRQIASDVGSFAEETRRADATIRFSKISELEIRLQGMQFILSRRPGEYLELLEELGGAMELLEDLKKRGIKGFERLDRQG